MFSVHHETKSQFPWEELFFPSFLLIELGSVSAVMSEPRKKSHPGSLGGREGGDTRDFSTRRNTHVVSP
jgi:hypothetical protein